MAVPWWLTAVTLRKPNLKAFCFNGLLMSDRKTTPKYWEVKKVYEPVELKMENEKLKVTNRNHHIDLSSYRCLWTVSIDGKQKEQGEFTLPGNSSRRK